MKKIIALSLAATLAISPSFVRGDDLLDKVEDIVPISAPIANPITEKEYMEYKGKIVNIESIDGKVRLLVEKKLDEGTDSLVVHISDDVSLLDDKTMDFVKVEDLKKDMEVSVFYHKHTPVALSLPAQLTPNAIVIRNEDEGKGVEVSKFNKDYLNAEGSLYVRPRKETVIIDKDGNKVEESELANSDWIAFYSIVLESYPAQTYADKIIVLPKKEEASDSMEVVLKHEFFKNEKEVTMIPLREVAEGLGYKVTWNKESKSAEIQRGPQWSLITIGKDSYNFARMHIELGTAPVLKDSKTYVPLSFAEEVLRATVEILEDGTIKIIS